MRIFSNAMTSPVTILSYKIIQYFKHLLRFNMTNPIFFDNLSCLADQQIYIHL